MPVATYGITVQLGGISIQKTVARQSSGDASVEVDLLAGKAGELTTRTDDDTGVATMDSAEHGIETGERVDVYWDGGQRTRMFATVAGDEVTVDGGEGDVLPIATTELVVTKQQTINITIDGDNAVLIAISMEPVDPNSVSPGHIDFQAEEGDSSSLGNSIESIDLTAHTPVVYDLQALASNPFTGEVIVEALASIGSATEGAKLKIALLYNASP